MVINHEISSLKLKNFDKFNDPPGPHIMFETNDHLLVGLVGQEYFAHPP